MSHSLTVASPSRRQSYAAVLALLLLGVGVWHARAGADDGNAPMGGSAAANDDGVGILLGMASTAARDQRVVAPQGNNAYEFYLSALQLDPGNAKATRYLRELFAQACRAVALSVSQGKLDEAARELRLLRDYDGSSYKLSLLGGYLDAQRVLMTEKHEAQARLMQMHRSDPD